MASILSLRPWHKQPELLQEGNDITYEEQWILQITGNGARNDNNAVQAQALIASLSAGNAYNFPVIGASHPDNSALKSTGIRIARDNDGSYKFTIGVSFSNSQSDQANSSNPANDFDRATYRYEEVDNYVDVVKDPITNKMIVNTAKRPIFPYPRENKPLTRIVITRNERNYSDKKASGYRNKINSSTCKIKGESYAKRTLKLESWSAVTAFDQDGDEYFIHTYKVLVDPNEHKKTFISVGYEDINGSIPASASLVGRPWKLNEAGSFVSTSYQNDPTQFAEFSNYTLEEVDLNFLRL